MTVTTIQLRRGTASKAAADDVTLAAGEVGVETDTGKFKIGDGATPWNALPYATDLSRLPGTLVSVEGPSAGDFPQWDGTAWVPGNPGINNDGLAGATLADLSLVSGPNSSWAQTSGRMYMTSCRVSAAATRVAFEVDSPGSGLAAGQNLIGIYDTNGNLVTSSGDLSVTWSSPPDFTVDVVNLPQTVPAGFYQVAVLMNYGGGTSPYLTGTRCPMITEIGTGFAPVPRACFSSATYTALPSRVRWSADGFTSNPWNFVTFVGFLP